MKSWKEHKKRYIIILLGIVIITGVIAWNKYIDPKLKYDHMLDEFSSKHYVEAQIIADDLAGYKDSSTYSLECEYQLAVIKMGKTDTLENAKKSFENIITYKDSEKLRDDCCYMLEKEAYEQGDFKKVMEYYEMLPEDYEADSEDYNPEDINMTSKWIDQLQGTWKCLNQIAGWYNYEIDGWNVREYFYKPNGNQVDHTLDHIIDKKNLILYDIIDKENSHGTCHVIYEDFNHRYDVYKINGELRMETYIEKQLPLNIKNGDFIEYDPTREMPFKKDDISKGEEPAIWMTYEEVLSSTWGKPEDINSTEYEWGTTAQWCYSHSRYIYFEDGVVTTIQR